ncbi:hypothetical protein [Gordonia sp. DT101]|uniref:hypothetical protein n=1 Tax=Gordonia sp. DT101 TaxID=3416545 RepID=UPI003CE98B71
MPRLASTGEEPGLSRRAQVTAADVPDRFKANNSYYYDRVPTEPDLDNMDHLATAFGIWHYDIASARAELDEVNPRHQIRVPHWRVMLAQTTRNAAFTEWCAERGLLDDAGRPLPEYREAVRPRRREAAA